MKLRSRYNYDRAGESAAFGFLNDQPSLTQQSQKDDADINVIMRRYASVGAVTVNQKPPPLSSDFAETFDFRTAMDTIRAAQLSFAALDADVRFRFRNDPARFIEFCENPDNLPELRKMGLAPPEPLPPVDPPPTRVTIVAADGAPAPAPAPK